MNWNIDNVILEHVEFDRGHRLFAHGSMVLTDRQNKIMTGWIAEKLGEQDIEFWHSIDWVHELSATGTEIPGGSEEEIKAFIDNELKAVNWQQAVQQALPQL